jgi:putative phage-type endonuclease
MSEAETITGRRPGVLVPTATEAGWLEARRQGVTASEVAVLMGLAPDSYGSAYSLYHRKRGTLGDIEDTLTMRIGRHFESLADELFAERHPEFSIAGDGRQLYAHPDRAWQMATPDRLVWDMHSVPHWPQPDSWEGFTTSPSAVLECKKWHTYDGWGEDGSDDIPVHFRCQVLWQCDVIGVDSWFLAVLFTHADKFRVYEGVIDSAAEHDLDLMRAAALEFRARVLAGFPPEVDYRPATADALKKLHPDLTDDEVVIPVKLAARYRAASRAYKAEERRRALVINQIRERAGSARTIITAAGDKVATRQVYDVKEHAVRNTHIDKLVPAREEGH